MPQAALETTGLVELYAVDPNRIDKIWPRVRAWLVEASRRSDFTRWAQIEGDILSGALRLWVVWDGRNLRAAVATEIIETGWRKICRIVSTGGEDMREWVSLIGDLEDYARSEGCDVVQELGREGWERVLAPLGYKRTLIVMEKEL